MLCVNIIFAYYKQDPIMIALSGAYNTVAKGYQSVGVNPANLSFSTGTSISLLNMNLNMLNNFMTRKRLLDISGANLENSDAEKYFPKNDILGYLNGEPIHITSTDTLSDSLLVTGFPYVHDDKWEISFDLFKELYGKTQGIRRLGAAALDFCFVAMGRFDGFWEFGLQSWDVCAGALILKEAGGKVTDWDGSPMPFSGRRVLATNGNIHDELIKTLGKELL